MKEEQLSLAQQELQEISELYRDYINPDLTRLIKFSGYGHLETHSQGSYVYDETGEGYLDFSGGYGVFNMGHSHPQIVEAVSKQLQQIPLSPRVFFSKNQALLAQKLAQITPGDLTYSFFCNSGAEANEAALKLARAYTQRTKFVATLNSFHGKTMGALSLSGRPRYQEAFSPLLPEVVHLPFNDIKALEETIDENTAAFILELVQGEGGIHVASQEFVQRARELCDQHQALLIVDEVQTAMGRTGVNFALEHYKVKADLLTLAKALGGGVMPLGAMLSTPQVFQAYKGSPLLHTSTFGGNPLACAAGLAAIEVLQKEELSRKAKEQGDFFLQHLHTLASSYPQMVQEVRGLGLMIGFDFTEPKFAGSVISEMARQKVIAVYTLNQPKVIRFEPSLLVKKEEIERVLSCLEKALSVTKERFSLR